jgi:hypothetical protein
MRGIYEQAAHTATWLGDGATESGHLMTQMNALDSEMITTNESSNALEDIPFSLSVFDNWCRHPYWFRIWIQQEQKASHDVTFHCGRKSVPREKLLLAAQILEREDDRRRRRRSISDYDQETDILLRTYSVLGSRMARFMLNHTMATIMHRIPSRNL